MNIEKIKYEIKEEEGYRDIMYKDHLGFATIGYGHLVLPTDKFKEGVRYDLCKDLDIVDEAKEIIIHMCFQLGKPKTAKFKKMFEALRNKEYTTAGFEMEDSLWAKQHTPARAHRLSEKMKKLT
jgi:lysozyme